MIFALDTGAPIRGRSGEGVGDKPASAEGLLALLTGAETFVAIALFRCKKFGASVPLPAR